MQTIVIHNNFNTPPGNNQTFFRGKDHCLFSNVSKENFDELLSLYPPKERIIRNCKYSNGELLAQLVAKDISYSIANPDYYTTEQLILAISQMGYLLYGLSIQDKKYTYLDNHLYKHFLLKMTNLECFYTKLNLRFKKKLLKKNDIFIKMSINKANYYPKRRQLLGNLSVKIGESFFAEAQLVTI